MFVSDNAVNLIEMSGIMNGEDANPRKKYDADKPFAGWFAYLFRLQNTRKD